MGKHPPANCGGRTTFLEDSAEWIKAITDRHKGLEVHKVAYRGKLDDANTFLAAAWEMELPASVASTCYDVVLVDAPLGVPGNPASPGRMESVHMAHAMAKRCVQSGKKESVTVFVHDVERPVEAALVQQYFVADAGVVSLGLLQGAGGNLAAFRVVA